MTFDKLELCGGRAVIYRGDCREVLPTLGAGSFDCVVTDPPYGINTKSDGTGKLSPWADLCNSSLWYADWLASTRKLLRPTGCLWSFLNWRSLTTFQKASCDIGWPIESLLVWDKEWIGPGGNRGLRPSYELVALWCGSNFAIDDRGIPDIRRSKWASFKPSGHPAEKPIDLVAWLIDISTSPGALVGDWFMGSGTTAEACGISGRDFVGCEMDETWFAYCRDRIARAEKPLTYQSPKVVDAPLFVGGGDE